MDQLFLNSGPLPLHFNIPPPPPLAPLSPMKMLNPTSANWSLPPSFCFPPMLPFPIQCEELYTGYTPHPALEDSLSAYLPFNRSVKFDISRLDTSKSHLDSSCSSVLNLTAVKQELLEPLDDNQQPTQQQIPQFTPEPIPNPVCDPVLKPSNTYTKPAPTQRRRKSSNDQVPVVPDPSPDYKVADCLSSSEQWDDLLNYITTSSFSTSEHAALQKMWFNAVYEIHIKTKNLKKHLTPAVKYRLRKTNPIPASISSVQPSTNNYFTAEAKHLMETVFNVNKRPDPETVKMLSQQTGLTAKQIRNFFKNKRSRS